MAFPTVSILDPFTGTGALSASWASPLFSGGGTMERLADVCTRNATFGYANAYYLTTFGGSGVPDEVFGTMANVAASDREVSMFIGMATPATAGIDGYTVVIQNGTWQVRRIDNEAETALGADITQALTAGDGVGMSRDGAGVIEIWYRSGGGSWVSKGTRSDSTYLAAGVAGIGAQGNSSGGGIASNGAWEDFGAGNTVTGGAASPVPFDRAFPHSLVRM